MPDVVLDIPQLSTWNSILHLYFQENRTCTQHLLTSSTKSLLYSTCVYNKILHRSNDYSSKL